VKRLMPSGRLFVFIEQQGTGETKITDRKDQLLEQQFDRIFEVIATRHQGSVSRLAEWAQWDRDRKVAETRRQEEDRQRKEAQEQAERERQLRNNVTIQQLRAKAHDRRSSEREHQQADGVVCVR
jgi:hypothetical protein